MLCLSESSTSVLPEDKVEHLLLMLIHVDVYSILRLVIQNFLSTLWTQWTAAWYFDTWITSIGRGRRTYVRVTQLDCLKEVKQYVGYWLYVHTVMFVKEVNFKMVKKVFQLQVCIVFHTLSNTHISSNLFEFIRFWNWLHVHLSILIES